MAGQTEQRRYVPITFGGVLDESRTPSKIGGGGLVGTSNLTYRRYGAWGKRAGSGVAYVAPAVGPTTDPYSSGIRWYRAAPSPLTKLVIASQGALWTGGDPNLVSPFSPLTNIATAQNNSGAQAAFAPVKDPSAYGGSGGDILIICGLTSANGFGTGKITLSGTPAAGDVVGVQVSFPPSYTLGVSYAILSTDNLDSIAQALVALINESSLVSPTGPSPIAVPPPLNSAYVTTQNGQVTVNLGSLLSGVSGNAIQYQGENIVGSSVTISPVVMTHLAGGGFSVSTPLRYDGSTVSGLSYQIQQPFTGCVSWHDHVWYWGDPSNPDTLYASDIDQPVGFTFMNQEGGYDIGAGDGDPAIQACIPIGNILYVFKRTAIYAITGYDFQSGEYQFQVQPALTGTGIPAPGCATLLNNTIIYWDGSKFNRLSPGATLPELIGRTIPLTSGRISNGNPKLMRAASGDFTIKTLLNNVYAAPGGGSDTTVFSNVALFACDAGNGRADAILAYDDDASTFIGNYAWSVWNGLTVEAFIPFGNGEKTSQIATDPPTLFWIPNLQSNIAVYQYGAHATLDAFNGGLPLGISWFAQTAWDSLGTASLIKEAHRLLLDAESNPGAKFVCSVTASGPVNGQAQTVYPPQIVVFPTAVGVDGNELNQTLVARVNPFLKGFKFLFAFSEPGNNVGFELAGVLVDSIEQAFQS